MIHTLTRPRTILLIALIVLLAALALASCGAPSAQPAAPSAPATTQPTAQPTKPAAPTASPTPSSASVTVTWVMTERDSVELTENYAIWWSYVPHFLQVPGYVYAYAFGELLVLALFPMMVVMLKDFDTVPAALQVVLFAIPFSHPMMAMRQLSLENTAFVLWGIVYGLAASAALTAVMVRVFRSEILVTGVLRTWMRKLFKP